MIIHSDGYPNIVLTSCQSVSETMFPIILPPILPLFEPREPSLNQQGHPNGV
jgi:hypothetical protein